MRRRKCSTLHKTRAEVMADKQPLECPNMECDGELRLKDIRGRTLYQCTDCNVSVGAFAHGKLLGKPISIPADKETSRARTAAHWYFDRLWKGDNPPMSRRQAYEWLRVRMEQWERRNGIVRELTEEECHIGRFTHEQCTAVCKIAIKFLKKIGRYSEPPKESENNEAT